MKAKLMHTGIFAALMGLCVATGTLGSVHTVEAKTVNFVFNGDTSTKTSVAKADTASSKKKSSIGGISYDKLVMADVSEAVNIRDAGSENGKIIGKLYKDCGGEIIERKNGWTKLKTGNVTGYVKDEYLYFGDEAYAMAEKVVKLTATSTTSSLRVRKEPNTDATILDLLGVGDKIEAISKDDEWVKVEFSDGDIGYVSSQYVTLEESIDSGESIEEINKRKAEEKKVVEAETSKTTAKESGNSTAAASATTTTSTSVDPSNVNNTLLLAALIQAESGTQPYEGQVAVGNVVVNRLASGRYSSLYGVVYAKGQFGPASSGLVAKIYAAGPKASCVQAATDALNGVNYIGTATHFRNVNSGYQGIVIGSHVFW